ncbi:C6 zinc finger domain protein [Aspergillus granulosus]|uniref:C6 zinc finger domain protein n=1 Tax=Aspergillus granulosus TaxID=176169 RepID=A0ABR4HN83_9EURO
MPENRPPKRRSPLSQKRPPKPRRRACDSCFKKKIQCDTEFPQCNWCKHHNLACTFNRIRTHADTGNRVTVATLGTSEGFIPNIKDGPRGLLGGSSSQAADSMWSLRIGDTFLNNVTYLRGHHVFSDEGQRWISSQVGESVNFDKVFSLELRWLKPLRSYTNPGGYPSTCPQLPSRVNVERYVQIYGLSSQSLVFPVISRSIFNKTLDLAYSHIQSPGSTSAKSCVYAFLSLISLFGLDDSIRGAIDCQSYASAAQSFVIPVIEEMTVDGLQTLIMLVQLHYFLGDLQSAAAMLSLATRIVYTLGGHTVPTNKTSAPYDKGDLGCHLRDLFWLCYSFDKDICLRTGQPPCINDAHCELAMPFDYVRLHDLNLQQSLPQIDEHLVPLFPWDLRLSMLKSKVFEDLYTAHSLQKSVSELLSAIRSLDEALEQWRLSLPAEFRPTLYFSRETPVSGNVNTTAVILRLGYYHCVTVIHQASSRCQILGADLAGPRLDGIASSTKLSITASRSTLFYLHKVLPVVNPECFWVVLFYAITAVLTLFCHIISNPRDPDTGYNMELLQNVPSLIQSIPIRKLTAGEVIHLQYLDDFTAELTGICARAISKS